MTDEGGKPVRLRASGSRSNMHPDDVDDPDNPNCSAVLISPVTVTLILWALRILCYLICNDSFGQSPRSGSSIYDVTH